VAINLTTSWDLIQGAAGGDEPARQQCAERYEPVVRSYLGQRWRACGLAHELEDAVQEVFVDCLRTGGALQRADEGRGEFRGFLFGVVRTVALRFERTHAQRLQRGVPAGSVVGQLVGDETAASVAFDREWARATLRLAMDIQAQGAQSQGEPHQKRLELLRLRFHEGMPIRAIAERWQCDAAWLHHEFARARRDFKRALGQALGLGQDVPAEQLEREIQRLWEVLR
jgi:RNA polymerase sigma-70 factor (ECF subfamily)